MCGYCIERVALEILSSDLQGILRVRALRDPGDGYFYLRETPHFLTAFDKLSRSYAKRRIPFFSDIPHQVLLYRGLEILQAEGFESPLYQQLLKKRLYREAVAATCTEEDRKSFDTATDGLDLGNLAILYDSAMYLTGSGSAQLADMTSFCETLLDHYHYWWLDGEGQTVFEDEVGRSTKNFPRFQLLCRAVYFGILQVSTHPSGTDTLLRIAQECPAGGVNFSGDDLWLQRVASLKLYDLEGPHIFYQHLTTIRATVFTFLDTMRKFSVEQKIQLLAEARLHPQEKTDDGLLSVVEWLSEKLSDPDRWATENAAELRSRWG